MTESAVEEPFCYVGGPRCGEPVVGGAALARRVLVPTRHSPKVRHVYCRSHHAVMWAPACGVVAPGLNVPCMLYVGEIEILAP